MNSVVCITCMFVYTHTHLHIHMHVIILMKENKAINLIWVMRVAGGSYLGRFGRKKEEER